MSIQINGEDYLTAHEAEQIVGLEDNEITACTRKGIIAEIFTKNGTEYYSTTSLLTAAGHMNGMMVTWQAVQDMIHVNVGFKHVKEKYCDFPNPCAKLYCRMLEQDLWKFRDVAEWRTKHKKT